MTHSDDDGLVLPPKLAPLQVVIVPVPKTSTEIDLEVDKLIKALKAKGITVKYDTDQKNRPGFKFAEHELNGVPVRVAVGKRDLDNGQFEIARRDTKEKSFVPVEGAATYIENLLDDIQTNLYQRALTYRNDHITKVDNFDDFQAVLDGKGGFVAAHWDGTTETEEKIKDLTKATIRCIPLDAAEEDGKDMLTGMPSKKRVLFAKAY
jgi:prolyl-tRNA synthetase